jgi:outer membrane protein OmpA-like peptidoglycan-associated protein
MKSISSRVLIVMCCLALVAAAHAAEQAASSAPSAQVKVISFPPNAKLDVPFQPMSPSVKATGKATVSTKEGTAQIMASFKDLEPPSSFGPEYLVYVLWAVTPQAKVANLGQVRLNGTKGEITATTRFQAFAFGITAEPHFAVTTPSQTVVLINAVPNKKDVQTAPMDVKAELVPKGFYQQAGLKPASDPKTPIELYQARNAVQIAKSAKAEQYAAPALAKAADALGKAEAANNDKKGKPEAIIMASREAVQMAEDARGMAVRAAEADSLASERKANAEREAAAKAAAESETQKRKVAEAQMAESEAARTQALAGQQQAQAQALQAQAQAASAMKSSQTMRAELLAQLNRILATKDTDRGLVTTMTDVTFNTDSAELKPGARESLAKLAGVLSMHPGLKLEVEGYTDNVGSEQHNKTLSENRAKAVMDYLGQQGITTAQMTSKGLGMGSPISPNDTQEGRAKNRRVEIVVSGSAIGTKIGG